MNAESPNKIKEDVLEYFRSEEFYEYVKPLALKAVTGFLKENPKITLEDLIARFSQPSVN